MQKKGQIKKIFVKTKKNPIVSRLVKAKDFYQNSGRGGLCQTSAGAAHLLCHQAAGLPRMNECPLRPMGAKTGGAITETTDKPIRGPLLLPTFKLYGAHLAMLAG